MIQEIDKQLTSNVSCRRTNVHRIQNETTCHLNRKPFPNNIDFHSYTSFMSIFGPELRIGTRVRAEYKSGALACPETRTKVDTCPKRIYQ